MPPGAFCRTPSGTDHPAFARGDGDRRGPTLGGQGFLGREAGAHVAELGQQRRRPDPVAGPGQAGEDVLVGVDLQALDDLGFQLAFLAAGDLDGVQQGQHADRPSGRLGRADPGCWGGLQAAEQLADGRAAAVVQAAQEGSEGGLGEGGGGVAGG